MLIMCTLVGIHAATIVVSTDITANTTWTNNNVYVLQGGFIYVTNNATLTIQAGTIVKGNSSSLVITRGAKIQAIGTATSPIIFTSNQPAGNRSPSDWGGVLILGNAPINDPAGQRLAEGGIDAVKGLYGGTNPADNSGTMKYCRIEFAGIAYLPNNETNGLTLGGVGSGTVIENIQVSHGGDDSFEWFGGNVNAKYLVAYRGLDDDFDTDYGYSGKVQFAVVLRDSLVADVSGSNGFESDNDGSGTTNTPNTNATFTNVSIFGPKRTNTTTINTNYRRGLHLRRSTQQDVYNSVIVGYPTGLKIENTNTGTNVTNGSLQFKNNILAGMGVNLDSSGLNFGMKNWFNANSNATLTNPTDVMAINPYNYNAPNFLPQSGSPMLIGADFTSANLQDPYLTPVAYRGAFGASDWTACWTEFNPQTQAYTTGPVVYMAAPIITSVGATTFCQGGSVTLNAPAGFTAYSWSNGATTQSIAATTSGVYTCTVSNARGCALTSNAITVNVKSAPIAVATATGPTTFCTGNSVLLTSNNATGYSFQWTNNGTNIAGATTPFLNATASGSYAIKTTKNGCTTTSTPVVVTLNANPTATITGNLGFCLGSGTVLSAPTGTGLTYQWSQGGSAIPGATNATYTAITGGSYTVDVTNAANCTATSAAATVTATLIPVVTITPAGSTTVCAGASLTLTATNVVGATYQWIKNGQQIQGATTNVYATGTTAQAGTYTVQVNKNGCTFNPPSTTVGVQSLPVVTVAGSTTVCSGVSVVLTSSGGNTFQWFNNGTAVAGATSVSHAATVTGNYTVRTNGCTSATPISVTVNPLPTATATANGATTFCLGNNVSLAANTGTGLAYQWRKSTANIPSANAATYNANTSGSYSVKVTDANGCSKTSNAISVVANAVPSTPTNVKSGVTLTTNATVGRQWFKDGVAISGATNATYTVTATGCYHVTTTNTTGCVAASDTVCFSTIAPPSITNDVVIINGENTEKVELMQSENGWGEVSIVPNPNNGVFDIVFQTENMLSGMHMIIFNALGQVVYDEKFFVERGESLKNVSLSNMDNGVYFVRILSGNAHIERKMVISK